MRVVLCSLSALALCLPAAFAQDRPTLQKVGNPKKVLPTKIGSVGPDNRVIEWRDYHPRQDCPHRLVFDCFEPDDAGWPTGFDTCGVEDGSNDESGGSRWYFGSTYCNMYASNDMAFDPTYGGEYVTRFEVAWHWTGDIWEQRAIFLEVYEDFDDTCQEGDPDHQGESLGAVLVHVGFLVPGGYWTDVDLCGLDWLRLPADGAGSYNIWLLTFDGYDPQWPDDYRLATCAQPLLWGTGEDEHPIPDDVGRGEMSHQGPIQWDDDDPPDGWHAAPNECHDYGIYDVCPDPLGAMACFYVCACNGDLDGDCDSDQADLGILLTDWGCTGGECPGDLDGDGDTDQADLGVLLPDWGCGT